MKISIDVNQSESIEKIEKGIIGSWITENHNKNNDQRDKLYFFGFSGARYSPFQTRQILFHTYDQRSKLSFSKGRISRLILL